MSIIVLQTLYKGSEPFGAMSIIPGGYELPCILGPGSENALMLT